MNEKNTPYAALQVLRADLALELRITEDEVIRLRWIAAGLDSAIAKLDQRASEWESIHDA